MNKKPDGTVTYPIAPRVWIFMQPRYTRTYFADGKYFDATPNPLTHMMNGGETYADYLHDMGYITVVKKAHQDGDPEEIAWLAADICTRHHEIAHTWAGIAMGKQYSQVIWDETHGITTDKPEHWEEEAKVEQIIKNILAGKDPEKAKVLEEIDTLLYGRKLYIL